MFKSTASDDSVYVTTNPDPSAYAALGTHVDDMPTIGTSAGIDQVRAVLSDKFDITEKNLGDEGVIMGVQYLRDRQNRRLKLHQTASAEELLAANNMTDCKGVNTPIDPSMAKAMMLLPTDDPDPVARRNYQSLVGCLMCMVVEDTTRYLLPRELPLPVPPECDPETPRFRSWTPSAFPSTYHLLRDCVLCGQGRLDS
jgi:hypothetical protein